MDKVLSYTPSGDGESILVNTDLVTVKVRSEDSGGLFALIEVSTSPGGGPPALHRHADQEAFYILEGTYRFDTVQEGQPHSIEAGAGSAVHVPGMVWHNYQNIGTAPARMIVILQPGDILNFFRELGISVTGKTNPPVVSDPPDTQRAIALTKKHQIEVLATHS